jgi:hypothetical protein
MTTSEMARHLNVSASSIERKMRMAIAWLHHYLTHHPGAGESQP